MKESIRGDAYRGQQKDIHEGYLDEAGELH